jgi:hypothetical protein
MYWLHFSVATRVSSSQCGRDFAKFEFSILNFEFPINPPGTAVFARIRAQLCSEGPPE